MPELAEVEYYRHRWDPGLRQTVTGVDARDGKRIFRGLDLAALRRALPGAKLLASEARGKQMLFRFSKSAWLGVHLGMTGELAVAAPDYAPGRHDHLVLYQRERALVFRDPRQFGRVRFALGRSAPDWWTALPEPLTAPGFTVAKLRQFLERHRRAPLKAVLLRQEGFPGVGNWMADEILWRARLHPPQPAGELGPRGIVALWRMVRQVCRGALRHVSPAHADPPRGWLFHARWEKGGRCPRHGTPLRRATVGGRTTVWCPRCQPEPAPRRAVQRSQSKKPRASSSPRN